MDTLLPWSTSLPCGASVLAWWDSSLILERGWSLARGARGAPRMVRRKGPMSLRGTPGSPEPGWGSTRGTMLVGFVHGCGVSVAVTVGMELQLGLCMHMYRNAQHGRNG